MNHSESFSDSIYTDQVQQAERELSAFVTAVQELFGPEQARISTDDWLDESELMDSPPRSESRQWRAITVAAAARLANRLDILRQNRKSPAPATDTEALPTLSSNCFDLMLRA